MERLSLGERLRVLRMGLVNQGIAMSAFEGESGHCLVMHSAGPVYEQGPA
jgi:hypothetical protein